MSTDSTSKPETLTDAEIVSEKKISRRSLLASTGIGFAAGATALTVGVKMAHAADKKEGDLPPSGDRNPPDPTRKDTD